MKYILFALALLTTAPSVYAQKAGTTETAPALPIDPNTHLMTYTAVVEVPGATKDELYARALEWMAKTYQSANDVVQLKDKAAGEIIAKGGIPFFFKHQPCGYVVHTQTLFVKDGRYKFVMTDFKHVNVLPVRDWSMGPLEQPTTPKGFLKRAWAEVQSTTDEKAKAMIASLEQAMQAKGKAASDF
ncbi:DUF4468 domain-containing protein [Hymenobacter properus]|uniref:DUF4468 domain-containing protein n=1 Tax=Hymenobacter properus TaxID=2791026 RepID=A0A931BGL8_9BACT|nr:DUF4468 domain-containing protein [Hymenobacter properus]MBF9141932.1 DUF4468 domain-containing protein [Hymenobacter properus]MBR7720740.1 DUF4468 domain-containing protein [Microvirga sp. SRT04]